MSEKNRRRLADVLAITAFVVVLVFSLIILVVPAARHWSAVWDNDPFAPRTTTTTVTKVTGGFKGDRPAVVTTRGGGAAAKTVTTRNGRATERTVTTAPADESFTERALGESGLLIGRIALAVLAAFLAGAIVQRVVLGHYAVKVGTFELGELPAVAEDVKKGLAAVNDLTKQLKEDLDKERANGQEIAETLAKVAASTLAGIEALDRRLTDLEARIPPPS
jgi:hypothetical protein